MGEQLDAVPIDTAPIEVQLLGPVRVCAPNHDVLKLTSSEEAVLTLLAACPIPAARADLIDACAISEQTFRPLLSKLPRKLGLSDSIHRRADRLPGMIERNPEVVTTDVDRLRDALRTADGGDRDALRRALGLIRGPAFGGVTYVTPNRAVELSYDSVNGLIAEVKRRAARSDLIDGGADGWLIDRCPAGDPEPAELRLARLLQVITQAGPGGAASIIGQLDVDPSMVEAAPVQLPTGLVGRLLVASSGHRAPAPAATGRRSEPMTRAANTVVSHLADPQTRLVLVEGPAGIGKSHLLDVLATDDGDLAWGPGGRPAVVRGRSFDDRGAHHVLAQLAAAPAEQLARRLDPRLGPIAGGLVELLEVDGAATGAVEHDRRAVRTVAELLTVAFPDQSLLLIDDVHVTSPDLEHLIDDVIRLTPPNIKVVACLRPCELDARSPWAPSQRGAPPRVRVGTLRPHDVEQLLGPHRVPIAGPLERLLARTEGRPLGLLVRSDSDPSAGLLAHLRAAIASRPRSAQLTLAVVALAAADLDIDADLADALLAEANLSWSELGADVAADEIVVGEPGRRRFGHGMWKDALGPVLLFQQRRQLHLAAYRHLLPRRSGQTARLAVLARHALGAGQGLERGEVLAAVVDASTAANVNRDYVTTRKLIDEALRQAWSPTERLQLIALRAAANRLGGWWDDALADYRVAVEAALASDDRRKPAELVLDMAQAAWDEGPSSQIEQLLLEAQRRLGRGDRLLSDRLELCRAGGLDQDGAAGADRLGRDRIMAARASALARLEGPELALSLLHGRQALIDVDPPEHSLALAEQLTEAAGDDVLLLAHGLQASFVDLLRLDRRAEAGAQLRKLRDLARTPASATQAFGFLNCQTCWDLHLGRYDRVRTTLSQMSEFGERLGGRTFDQILLGQQFWLARDTGDTATLRNYASGARGLQESDPATPIWAAAEAVLLTDIGADADALDVVAAVHDRRGGFASLQRGPHRLATLALLSEAISRIGTTSSVPETMADDLYQALQAEAQAGVLAGWPTVFIGPVERFLGQAAVAAGRFEVARTHLAAAIRADRRSPALLLRSIDARLALEARSPEHDRSAVYRDDDRDGRGPTPLPVTELERIKRRLQTGLRRRH